MILNTMFKKRWEHLVTYASGGRRSQIDFILTRRQDKRCCKNCKVLPGEWEEEQHKMVVADMVWEVTRQAKRKTSMDVIKWGKMKDKERDLRECLLSRVNWNAEGDVEAVWECVAGEVQKICSEVLGVSKGGRQCLIKIFGGGMNRCSWH